MKSSTNALIIVSIALAAALFVAGPIVVEHQAFAAHHPPHKASSDSLRGVGYGPRKNLVYLVLEKILRWFFVYHFFSNVNPVIYGVVQFGLGRYR